MKEVVSIIMALVFFIAGYNLWPVMWRGFFYHCLALGILALSYLAFALSSKLYKLTQENNYRIVKRTSIIAVVLSVSNLIDELFFDPTDVQINEYVFALIVVVHQLYMYVRKPGK